MPYNVRAAKFAHAVANMAKLAKNRGKWGNRGKPCQNRGKIGKYRRKNAKIAAKRADTQVEI